MSDLSHLVLPTVHLNGTSKGDLLEAYSNAIQAVHAAGDAMAKAAPNGRDYYPQGSAAINTAMDQHAARMQKLRSIVEELELIAESI